MPTVNELKRLLDVDWTIRLWHQSKYYYKATGHNAMQGDYTFVAYGETPGQALKFLSQRMLGEPVGDD